jgi:predicted nucleic acid-binding protein
MTDTLVDTNVLLDIADEDAEWRDWSERSLSDAVEAGGILINPLIYAELAGGFRSREDLDAALNAARFGRAELPWDAAYAAGLAYLAYRRRGGTRTTLLPDFLIGAHAAVRGYTLLTRARGYYATYFPTLKIVSPETHP